jgi:hypothetical protein
MSAMVSWRMRSAIALLCVGRGALGWLDDARRDGVAVVVGADGYLLEPAHNLVSLRSVLHEFDERDDVVGAVAPHGDLRVGGAGQ